LKEACGIYKGEFLPALSSDEWVLIESLQYKKKYSDAMQKVCDLLMEKGDYEETLRVCAPACKLYPFDEWQTVRIRCYIALNRYKEAMKEYEDTAKLFFEELGLGPSEKMLELFENMSSNMTSRPQTLSEIRGKLLEDEKEGAYYVNFPSFRDNCRLVSRIIERSGQSVFLMQCSITDGKGRPMENEEKLRYMMQELSKAIKYNLRRGDAFTQYSSSQYLILLIGTNQEDCSIIYDRIQKYYTRNHGSWSKHLEYQILSIMALESTGG
jgi:tetratricopeptide (TPR) repeat protein